MGMYFPTVFPLVFIAGICFVSAQDFAATTLRSLICYECDPGNFAEQCASPVASGVQQITCFSELNSTLVCMSANITYSGVAVTNYCDWLKEEVDGRNAILTDCESCNTTRCNSKVFQNAETSSASSLFKMAFTAFIASVLFATLF
ncbi:hypothetical protein HUJ04_007400 [Dendroctonus ponderosae]|nr:hypothetical protein HUJ04_007400 [Dendroctonus ponderosae]KAH1025345.1 hypothetical protein HUJ05_010086 [Dendroctonus ponderosae]